MEAKERADMARLIRGHRWAALGTCAGNTPLASMVAYVPEPEFTGFLMLLSRLSLHTRHLLENLRASLAVSEADDGKVNPQMLPRVSIQGQVETVSPASPRYEKLRGLYLARFPAQEPLFGFSDFILIRLVPAEARYVAGFARAYTLSAADLSETSTL
jgi:putative heme iron utilization protein